MKWLNSIGRGISRGLAQVGRLWQRLLCWIFNLRRRLLRRGRPHYVVFTLEGELAERTPVQPRLYALLPFVQTPLSLESLSDALHHVAQDPDVRGVLFLIKGANFTLAQAQSMAALFQRFHQWDERYNGNTADFCAKEVVVYLEQSGNASYALAAAADRTFMPPLAEWNVIGLYSAPTFLADTLAKVGIQFDVVRIAPWKTAYDRFSQASISEANAAQINWLLDSLYDDLVTMIATGRGLPPAQVKALIDRAPLTAQEAVAAGLLDATAYEDEIPGLLQVERADNANGKDQEARLLPYTHSRRHLLRRPRRRADGRIGVISLSGTIMPGKSRRFPVELPFFGDSTIGSSTVQQQVRAALKDNSLSAVVLHIDSGGGSAAASDLMWRELSLLAHKRPLVVYMGSVAASGGYYIATPARRIIAQAATLTGSIGVISGKPITTGLYDRMEAHRYEFQRGDNASLLSDQEAWTGEQRRKIEAQVNHFYHAFKARVAEGRNLPYEDLDSICSGKVWTGKQAVANGLIDETGDFSLAVAVACELANLPTDGSVPVVNVSSGSTQMPLSAQKLELDEDQQAWVEKLLALVRQDWEELLGHDRVWFIADGLPKIK